MTTKELSAKLDGLIRFETESEKFNRAHAQWVNSPQFKQHVHDTRKKLLIGATGLAGTSAAVYGGYKLNEALRGVKALRR